MRWRSGSLRSTGLLVSAACALLGAGPCEELLFAFQAPLDEQLSLPGDVPFELRLPPAALPGSLEVLLDGQPIDPAAISTADSLARGVLSEVGEGVHRIDARVEVDLLVGGSWILRTQRRFEVIALQSPDVCEILNDVECLLPYPSSRFLEPAETETGWRLAFPEAAMPLQNGEPLSPEPYRLLDGFSPGVNPLLFFPGGVDLALSGAPGLDPVTRTFDRRSLEEDSPTLLVDAESGQRILHFVELDARAVDSRDPSRQVMFLRPGQTLTPGRRYIVAARELLRPDGTPVAPETAFAALRDGRPSTIAALEARRPHHEWIFERLSQLGVERSELLLAFDFVVQSDETLTGALLAMRDRAYAWLAEQQEAGIQTFSVTAVDERDCSGGGLWRDVQGTFQVPLFLTKDPLAENREPGFVVRDATGLPAIQRIVDARFSIGVPCRVLEAGARVRPLLYGHGGFANHRQGIDVLLRWRGEHPSVPTPGVPNLDSPLVAPDYIVGGTDNHGFGELEFEGLFESFLVKVIILDLDNAAALPARVQQGQVNVLVLGRMMKRGLFNGHPAFQTPDGTGVFPGPEEELYMWGPSFGGFTTLIQAAISPDLALVAPHVAVVNFSNQAQRDKNFALVDQVLMLLGEFDAMRNAVSIAITHDLWAQGDPVGYLRHITWDPLPGSREKNVLLSVAWLDQQSPNIFSDVAARDLRLPSLASSFRPGLVEIPDGEGSLAAAYVAYAVSLDADDPDHAPFIPPLANLTPRSTACDPHVLSFFTPAFLDQLGTFLRPDGRIESFCEGICDGAQAREREFGNPEPCDPLAGLQ